jgi:FkbH-like protein
VVVRTRPETVLGTFNRVLSGHEGDETELEQEVDIHVEQVLLASSRASVVFVPTWVVPPLHAGHGMLDLSKGVGVARTLMGANLRLVQRLDGATNVFPLNTSKWVELTGEKAFNPRLWYSGKVPFGNEFLKTAARDMKAALRGVRGRARKLVILDLDETLWGGIVGEIGWQHLALGGHDPAGEALQDLQRELKALTQRGIILALASKNEESVALEAIEKHPEMILRTNDFAAWRINWKDKAENIIDLVGELNLGLDAAVFVDDSPVERARVRDMLPEVLVPEWPADKRLYPQALCSLDCFDQPRFSKEDRQRTQMYVSARQRNQSRQHAGSLDDWLKSLDLLVVCEPVDEANLARVTQLLNKTNQMNLSTRRLSEVEFQAWVEAGRCQAWAFQVSDKFGDSGLSGVLSVAAEGERARIVDFVLSCRVMGRRIEETMLSVAVEWAGALRLPEVVAVYLATPKNKPCYEFLARSGWQQGGDGVFIWPTARAYPAHTALKLIHKTGPGAPGEAVGTN